MDYKEKYEKALEVAQRFYNNSVAITKKGLEDIFPELKESEDEKIRKLLIRKITQERGSLSNDEATKCIAWLEKQKDTLKDTLKDIEQKPEWSEEDEDKMILIEDRFSDYLDYVREDNSLTKYQKNSTKDEIVNLSIWLKSLKERHTWKPSETDILLLERMANGSSNPQDFQASLYALIGQLKKLREE